MSSAEDNVMDLLDSLDTKQTPKTKPKKSTSKRKESRKATGDDILDFLEEIDIKKERDLGSQPVKEANFSESTSSKAKNVESKGTAEDVGKPKETSPLESHTDPVSSLTSWWAQNSSGLWSKAQSTLQDAVPETVKQVIQAESNARDENLTFSFNSLQNRLTSVINTIIPPIARHEQLHIHIFHDIVGYPSIDKILYEVFDFVMEQVEGGGDLNMVIQKGKERHRVGSENESYRSLNLVKCTLNDAVKLAKANVENIPTIAESQKPIDPNIRISEIYISIQPVIPPRDPKNEALPQDIQSTNDLLYFIVYLLDREHNVEISTTSQALPAEWVEWLDGDCNGQDSSTANVREWVFCWVEDALNLAFGVTAQRYVTTRMGFSKSSIKDSLTKNTSKSD